MITSDEFKLIFPYLNSLNTQSSDTITHSHKYLTLPMDSVLDRWFKEKQIFLSGNNLYRVGITKWNFSDRDFYVISDDMEIVCNLIRDLIGCGFYVTQTGRKLGDDHG